MTSGGDRQPPAGQGPGRRPDPPRPQPAWPQTPYDRAADATMPVPAGGYPAGDPLGSEAYRASSDGRPGDATSGGHRDSDASGRRGGAGPASDGPGGPGGNDLGSRADRGRARLGQRPQQVSSFPGHRTTLSWPRPGTGAAPVVPQDRRKRWLKVLGRTVSKAWADSLFRLASEGAFWSALSTAPLLLALLGMVGFVGNWFGPDTIDAVQEQVLIFLHGVFSPEVVDSLFAKNVGDMLHHGQADLVSVGFFVSLWAGSSAISAFIEAITIAYDQFEVRNPILERIFALGLYLIALISGVITLPLLAIGPTALTDLFPEAIRSQAGTIITVFYYPAIVVALVLLLATFYKVAPRYKHPWRRGIPGALLATAVFVVASIGLRIYVSYVYSHGLTYGALATPITFLLFYYMMSLAIVIGAQFNNATLEYFPPRVTAREARKWQRLETVTSPDQGRDRPHR